MKKIILVVLIILAIPILFIKDSDKYYDYSINNFSDLAKDEKWEYVKDRVFNGYDERIHKYNGPILCELYNATSKDSLAVISILKELKVLIPNKEIGFFKNYTGRTLDLVKKGDDTIKINDYLLSNLKISTIKLNFKENNESNTSDSLISNKSEFRRIHDKVIFHSNIYSNDKLIIGKKNPNFYYEFTNTSNFAQRKKEIQRDIIHTIAVAKYFSFSNGRTVNSKKSILYDPVGYFTDSEFSELDKFLLKKLYSPNLKDEFKTYMYKTYPWNYASNYINKEKTKAIATWVSVAITIIFFILGFSILYNKEYQRNYFSYLLPTIYIMLSISYVFIIYFYFTNPYGFTNWKQYLAIHLLCLLIASLMALSLMLFDKYIIKNSMNFTVQVILKMSFTFFIGIIPIFIVVLAENNNQPWFIKLNPVLFILFALALGRGVLLYLEHFSENLIKEKDLELSQLKEVNAQAEVKLLQSQINPHFLYNALNSIASLAHKNADKTEKMALSLSDLFKYTINRKGKKDSTIGDEVEMVTNYLEVEQIRFDDRLNFTIDVDKSLENTKIPMFLIQPLIENAVKHGISKVENDGQITLSIHKTDVGFTIIVEDNGPDFPEGLVSGHGLQTVFDLLRLTYENKASITWENQPTKHIKITIENQQV